MYKRSSGDDAKISMTNISRWNRNGFENLLISKLDQTKFLPIFFILAWIFDGLDVNSCSALRETSFVMFNIVYNI